MAKFKPGDIVFWKNSLGEIIIEEVISLKEYQCSGRGLLEYGDVVYIKSAFNPTDTGWMLEKELTLASEAIKVLYGKK